MSKNVPLFPQLKTELVEDTGKLYPLEDQVDKLHCDCTITSVVTSPTCTASGIMILLGLVQISFMPGDSVVLTGAETALEIAGGMTSFFPGMVEEVKTSPDQDKVRIWVSVIVEKLTRFAEAMGHPPVVFSSTKTGDNS